MPTLRRAALALAGAALVAAAGAALPAGAAAAGPRFALEPLGPEAAGGWFVYEARGGDTLRGRIRVVNAGDRAGWVRLYAVDATTGQTTGAVYRTRRDARRAVGAWTTLGRPRVRLAAGAAAFVRFRVRIPRGATPGDHLGGLVVEDARLRTRGSVQRGAGRFSIRIRNLTIVAVQIRVPGPARPALALTGLRAGAAGGRQALMLGMRNTGNVLVKGRGRLAVTDARDRTVQRSRFPVDTFVPGTGVALPVPVTGKALGRGSYRAVAVVRYAGRTVRRRFGFSISPRDVTQIYGSPVALRAPGAARASARPPAWALAGGGAGVALGGFGAAALFFRRPRRPPT